MAVLTHFETALEQLVGSPASQTPDEPLIGHYCLNESDNLVTLLAEAVAQESNLIPSLQQFQQWFQHSEKLPREPKPDDLVFDPPHLRYSSKTEHRVAQAARYHLAKQHYEKNLLQFQKKEERLRSLRATYKGNAGDYPRYIVDAVSRRFPLDGKDFFFTNRPLCISEAARRRHTFITGGTGSGKSETIKGLVRHYLTRNTSTAVVVLDPHGKLVKDIARFKEFANTDRLVLIDPNLSDKHWVTINPFETSDQSESGLETQCAHLIAAFQQILGGFTMNMQSLLPPLVTALLHRPDSDLADLVRFLDDKRNNDLLEYGTRQLPYEEHRRFFATQFHSSNYESTKDALRNRFQAFLNTPTIKRFTCGKSTVNLEQLIDDRKVILVNLSVSGAAKTTTTILGQFVTALIQGYSMRRERYRGNPKTPIHLFADECQYFTSETTEEILGESRKYGLHLTLATQRTEQVGDKILDAILGNVGVFLVGRNLGKTLTKLSSELEIAKDDIRKLNTGEFYLSSLNRIPLKVALPLIGTKYFMTADQWRNRKHEQLSLYYVDAVHTQPEKTTGINTQKRTPVFPFPDISKLPDNPSAPDES